MAAMLLLVVVPLVSRCLPTPDGMSDMGMGCPMVMQQAPNAHAGLPADPDDPTVKCSYCNLLAHTPAVEFDVGIVLAPIDLSELAPQTYALRSTPFAQRLSARPRGPPRTA